MHLIRGVLIRDVGFTDMMPDVYWLTLFTIVVIAIAALRAKKNLDVLRSISIRVKIRSFMISLLKVISHQIRRGIGLIMLGSDLIEMEIGKPVYLIIKAYFKG
jgi:hypothetical protein